MLSKRFLSFAIAACMSLAAGFMATALAVATTARRCWDYATAWARPAADATQRKSPDQTRASVALVIARSYLARLLHRFRPNVTPGWRMCPSA